MSADTAAPGHADIELVELEPVLVTGGKLAGVVVAAGDVAGETMHYWAVYRVGRKVSS